MSDYLGPNQTRVLDSTNRSFESITYQNRKPPLSSEVNLTGKIDAERSQMTVQAMLPSGWASVGQIKENILASACKVGDILCSPGSSGITPVNRANALTLIAQDLGLNTEKSIAWVNGWRVVVQGINGPHNVDSGYTPITNATEDNLITLPPPPAIGSRIDFVFLEVWRKLITPDDLIYPYGNVDYYGSPFSNDLIDPARGFETSLRVQLQYRIRVAPLDDFYLNPEGGFNTSVYVQGPLDAPISTCSHANFTQVPGDPGLWIAGAGDSVAQETLLTVDGHTYAIPMFAISRRASHAYDPRDMQNNGCEYNLSNYFAGLASDRPDNLYNNWIVPGDIVDMRHHVAADSNLEAVCSSSFRDLQTNNLHTVMGRFPHGEDSDGATLLGVDIIAPTSSYDNMESEYISKSNGVRRWFGNAEKYENVFYTWTTSTTWQISDTTTFNLDAISGSFPPGAVFYAADIPYGKDGNIIAISFVPNPSGRQTVITISGAGGINTLLNTSTPMVIPITIKHLAGLNGLSQVPTKFLESRKIENLGSDMLSVAMKDQDIRVRQGFYADAVDTTDLGVQYNMLRARGGSTKHDWDFGHQFIYHALGAGNNMVSVPRDMSGYNILGIADIKINGTTTISNPSITWNASSYTIDMGTTVASGADIKLSLYTDNKYFDGNKQGRAITDCFQMTWLTPDETADGIRTTFTIDATTSTIARSILAVSSYSADAGDCYAYVGTTLSDGSREILLTANKDFPTDTPTYGTVEFSSAPLAGKKIKVPALVRTAIESSEGYAFFYEYSPYQGLLDTTTYSSTYITGSVEAVGSAITTTMGSGAVTDYTYSDGLMVLTAGTDVYGIGTAWLDLVNASTGNLDASYVFSANYPDSTKKYSIASVTNDSTLVLTTPADRASFGGEYYVIKAVDQPYFSGSNILDRFPTNSNETDASGMSNQIQTAASDAAPVLESKITSRQQDILDIPTNTAQIGLTQSDRGKITVYLPGTKLGRSTLGLNYEPLNTSGSFKKTYQSYVLNKNDSGQMYLMVVGSETDNTSNLCKLNAFSKNDSVDIFQMPGRPIVANRNK